MHPRKSRKKRQIKHSLILDENLFRKTKLPEVNRYHKLSHILHDLGKGGATDDEVLKLAKKNQAILVTKNAKDFRKKSKIYNVDIVGVTDSLATEPGTLDKKLGSYLRKRSSKKMSGAVTVLTR